MGSYTNCDSGCTADLAVVVSWTSAWSTGKTSVFPAWVGQGKGSECSQKGQGLSAVLRCSRRQLLLARKHVEKSCLALHCPIGPHLWSGIEPTS